MKAIVILLAATFAVALLPAADAAACYTEPPQEQLLEVSEGQYLYLVTLTGGAPGTNPSKIGFWEETNDRDGLQTNVCTYQGTTKYRADTKSEDLLA